MVASSDTAGWFVEVPKELKDEFKRIYPGRRQMKLLTLAAIQYALRERPTHLTNIPSCENRQLHVDDVAVLPGEVCASQGRLDHAET